MHLSFSKPARLLLLALLPLFGSVLKADTTATVTGNDKTATASADETANDSQPAAKAATPDSAAPATPAATAVAVEKATDAPLRELGATSNDVSEDKPEKPAKPSKAGKKGHKQKDNVELNLHAESGRMESVKVGSEEIIDEAVSITGPVTVNGRVRRDAVSILGDTTINGQVGQSAVSILGTVRVNGEVQGDAVAICGDVILGPKAVVHGKGVSVLGRVIRADSASVSGIEEPISESTGLACVGTWVRSCLFKGRLLAFHSDLLVFWGIAGAHLAFYLLLGLLVRKPTEHCVEVFRSNPGFSLVAALLTLLITPLVIVLLAITGIGAVIIPFLLLGLLALGVFGRVVMLAALGRLCTSPLKHPLLSSTLFSILLGGVLVTLLYCVPILGILLHWLLGTLGLGVVIYVLCQGWGNRRKDKGDDKTTASNVPPVPPIVPTPATLPALPLEVVAQEASISSTVNPPSSVPLVQPPPPVLPAAPVETATSNPVAPVAPAPAAVPVPPTPATTAQPPQAAQSSATAHPAQPGTIPTPTKPDSSSTDLHLPRAGFWLRMGALMIDIVLVAIAFGLIKEILPGFLAPRMGPFFLIATAIYGALFWSKKGTTIGGTICRLQVMRLDGRPLDSNICFIRALGCLVSAFVAGLGFLWIAIDENNESWHDKIAGTAVVIVPKSRPLV